MDEVYRGAETDAEKLKRLEDMLRSFTYTQSPGPLPERIHNASDFLDYFILESKQGFCSHFATAFVLLARAEGLPARYVQGYLVGTDGKRTISVKNTDAHAWPEVYFEGAGWIAYEPTPTIQKSITYWKTEEERQAEGSDPTENRTPLPQTSPEASSENALQDNADSFHFRWYMIVIPIGASVFFILLALILKRVLMRVQFKKKNKEEQFLLLCRQTIRILRLSGFTMNENETLTEYGERLTQAGFTDISFLRILEKYVYKNELEDDAIPVIIREKESLLIHLKKTNRRRYFRYLLTPPPMTG